VAWSVVEQIFDEMRANGRVFLTAAGVAPEAVTFRRRVDMRYAGQGFEVPIDIPEATAGWVAS